MRFDATGDLALRADDWMPLALVVGAALGVAAFRALGGRRRAGRRAAPDGNASAPAAGVAELADATDSKSVEVHPS